MTQEEISQEWARQLNDYRDSWRNALDRIDRLETGLARIRDRAQRIVDGEVETTAIGAADYDLQVIESLRIG